MEDTIALFGRFFEQPTEVLASRLKESLAVQNPEQQIVSALGREQIIHCLQRLSLADELYIGKLDAIGRFDEQHHKTDLLKPEVNLIIQQAGLTVQPSSFKVVFTHDIDWVTAMHPLSWMKSVKNTLTGTRQHWLSIGQQFNTGILYKTMERFLSLEKQYGVRALYFMMSGPSGYGRYDTRYDIRSKPAKKIAALIKEADMEIGLHGSFYAKDRNSYRIEKEAIEKATGVQITAHRNHYLRFDPVRLPLQLEAAGIDTDYSIGFTSEAGFRSGYCSSYRMPDIIHSRISNVTQIPLLMMDRLNHLDKGEQFFDTYSNLLDQIKQLNGTVSILTHPENFVFVPQFWEFYERLMDIAVSKGAIVNMTK